MNLKFNIHLSLCVRSLSEALERFDKAYKRSSQQPASLSLAKMATAISNNNALARAFQLGC